jgi:2-polyprenyl-3-methyl-5-hydroxy-6-metoxy-1,4-benzoquinol methylase
MGIWSIPFSRQRELMDDPALDPREHARALTALARINRFSRTSAHLCGQIESLLDREQGSRSGATVRVVDLGCGGGDLTAAVARRLLTRVRRPVEILGVDMSDRAITWARKKHAAVSGLSFATLDILAAGCPPCDVVIHSLVLHHFADGPAVEILENSAAAARLGGVFSDLLRSRVGLVLAHLGTLLLTRSTVAHVDGPRSVRAARTLPEYRRLLDAAGLPHARMQRNWPERVCISWATP